MPGFGLGVSLVSEVIGAALVDEVGEDARGVVVGMMFGSAEADVAFCVGMELDVLVRVEGVTSSGAASSEC